MREIKNESSQANPNLNVDAWFTPYRFSALLAVSILLTFPDVIFGLRTFVFRDFGIFTYPVAHYVRESFWRGELPLWNPYNFCGIPFLAQWNTMALYPPNLFFLVFPLSWSLGVFCLLHLFLAGLGTYWLAWRWTDSRLGACVAGVAFAYSGFMLSALMGTANLAALAWMPWVVFAVEKAWREGGRQIIYAAFVGTLQMLTGTPEYVLFTWLVLTAMTLVSFRDPHTTNHKPFATRARRCLSVVLLIVGLSAAQLLPFFDLLHQANRHGGDSDAIWSMPSWGWANFLVPLFRCHKTTAGVYFQPGQAALSSYYLSIGVFALALLAVWKIRGWRIWLLGAVALCGMVLALGDAGFLYRLLRQNVPIFGFMRYPVKFVVLTGFAVPLLAAFAVRELLAPSNRCKFRMWWLTSGLGGLLLLSIFLIILFAYRYPWDHEELSATTVSGLTRALFLTLTFGVLFVLSRSSRKRTQLLLGLSLVALIWFDLITHTPFQNPTVDRSAYSSPLTVLQEVKPLPKLGESRAMLSLKAHNELQGHFLSDPFNTFLLQRLGLFANCNLLDGIPQVYGFSSLHLQVMDEIKSCILDLDGTIRPQMADFLSISQVSSETNIFHWRSRPSFLPWVTVGQQPVFAEEAATLSALASLQFDPRQTVYMPRAAQPYISATRTTEAKILSSQFAAQELRLETEAKAPAILVVSQTYYHYWKPYVDGQPIKLWRANHSFQAIEIPAGRHRVRLAYEDTTFKTGLIVSLGTLLGCVALLLYWRTKRI